MPTGTRPAAFDDGRSDGSVAERGPGDLDDQADRDELRNRYYGLLQELRVILPGVQVLVAFLLTVPFASRFDQLDDVGRVLFGTAITSGTLAIIAFLVPTAYHRLGDRTARGQRLAWSIVATQVGLGLLALALVASLTVVSRFVFGSATAFALATIVTLAIVASWLLLPRAASHDPGAHGP
jgi:hypothetical protein